MVTPVLALLAALLGLLVAAPAGANSIGRPPNPCESDAYSGTAIGRANLDGTRVHQSFIATPGASTGIAVDADHIYWTDYCTSSIGRANLDGTDANQGFIQAAPFQWAGPPSALAVDSDHVYWSLPPTPFGPYLPTAIGRTNIDGSGSVEQRFIDGIFPWGIAVDADHIYWSGGEIGRADLDATNVDPSFVAVEATFGPYSVAVDVDHVYWIVVTEAGDNAIGRADIDGTNVDPTFVSGLRNVSGDLAVDAEHIYWANVDTNPPNTKITKTAPNTSDKTNVKFKFKSSEPNSTFECKLDKKKWKACESPKKAKGLAEGKHKFKVRAIDAAGNVDPSPAKDKFKVVN